MLPLVEKIDKFTLLISKEVWRRDFHLTAKSVVSYPVCGPGLVLILFKLSYHVQSGPECCNASICTLRTFLSLRHVPGGGLRGFVSMLGLRGCQKFTAFNLNALFVFSSSFGRSSHIYVDSECVV